MGKEMRGAPPRVLCSYWSLIQLAHTHWVQQGLGATERIV
jgi:hypothetical protein